jgi:DNA-binding Lrp family transcriptional regulator
MPALRDTLAYLRQRGRLTSQEVAQHFGVSIQNAHNRLAKLDAAGYARKVAVETHPTGGNFGIYEPTEQR